MTMQTESRGHRWRGAALAAVLLTGLTSSCANTKDGYVQQINQLCDGINARFVDDLAFGKKSFDRYGRNHLDILKFRGEALRDLRQQVGKVEAPQGTVRPDEWLASLDRLIEKIDTLRTDWSNTSPSNDAIVQLSWQLHNDAADSAGKAAAQYGLDSCAKTDSWRVPSSQ